MSQFSVCVLAYGPHQELAERCLGSIIRAADAADWRFVAELRIGLNAVSAETLRWVEQVAVQAHVSGCPRVTLYRSADNIGKYPLMRYLFQHRPLAPCTMWFDDDSYLRNPGDGDWWRRVAAMADTADVLGSIYRIRSRGQQWRGVMAQPWYTGEPVRPRHVFIFPTGGWWVIKSEILKKWDYPFPELYHRGGDQMLGELCRQQHYCLLQFNEGVAINANEVGKESTAKERGLTREDTPWLWQNFPDGSKQRPDMPDVTVEEVGSKDQQVREQIVGTEVGSKRGSGRDWTAQLPTPPRL